jgi:hypothetical protein
MYIGDDFKVKMLVTMTHDSHYYTFFGHLGQHTTKFEMILLCGAIQGGQGKCNNHCRVLLSLTLLR